MAIPERTKHNFNVLLQAAANGDLLVMECTDKRTGEPAYVICTGHMEDDEVVIQPLGTMCSEDPYDIYEPPATDDKSEHMLRTEEK